MAMSNKLFNNTAYSAAADADYLDDINEVLESIGEFPVTTAPEDPSGTMIHERALRFLERANTRVQAQGWPCNTSMSEAVSDASSLPEPSYGYILFIQGAGADGHRTLTLRRDSSGNPKTYDADTGGDISSAVTLDIVRKLSWETLPDLLKANIVSSAALDMQRRLQGSPQADAFYQQEKILRDQSTDRLNPMKKNSPLMNTQPLQQQQAPQQG
jgi:hypothetical protein